jgi:inorganic phosphate transporter, PiT family
LLSFFAGSRLLKLFSGKGIVSDAVVADPAFLLCVAVGAAITVMLATRLGIPVSTTHSLVGGLTGAGIASHSILSLRALEKSFVLPLIAGPIVAIVITTILYWLLHFARLRSGIKSEMCLCAGERQEVIVGTPGLYVIQSSGLRVEVEEEQYCKKIYTAGSLRFNIQKVMDSFHGISGGTVSFARGLNDTPKIAGLLAVTALLSARIGLFCLAVLMAIGGLIHSRRIADKMSFGITEMNSGQAFTGNFVTAILVISGTLYGLPLSTTHVSCGSIFGIGLVGGKIRTRTLLQIFTAWITTVPLAALLSAAAWILIHH